MTKEVGRKRTERIEIRLPEDLKRDAAKCAARRHTTMTALIVRFLVKLVQEDEKQHG